MTCRKPLRGRREGFTLIELLTVIAIIGILSALTLAGISRVRSGQLSTSTDQSMLKLQKVADQQWRAVIDQCHEDRNKKKIPAPIMAFCGNDDDTAEALWTYVKLKNELPQTFAEAQGDVCPNATQRTGPPADNRRGIWLWYPAVNTNPAVLILPPRATFKTCTGSGAPEAEAAVLLYLALSEKGVKGVNINVDEFTNSAQADINVGGTNYKTFKDAWGTPITFLRLAEYGEIQTAPYVNAKNNNKDPLDPNAKLFLLDAARKNAAHAMLGGTPFAARTNKTLTLVSAGENKTFNLTDSLAEDDKYGFRLRRQGNQGD